MPNDEHAFPGGGPVSRGMSLRDYFAVRAMHGWLTTYGTDVSSRKVDQKLVAEFAYTIADAMLEARETHE